MPFEDLRSFVHFLEQKDELIRVPESVDSKYEISAFIRKSCDTEGPAVYFENVKGYDYPVVGAIFSKRQRVLDILGASEETVIERFIRGLSNPAKPVMVDKGPCKDKILLGQQADILKLPVPTYSELDGGPFVTLGAVITKEPDTRARNIGIYRCQVQGPRKLSIMAQHSQHAMVHYAKAEARNEPLEVAIAIGVQPAILLAAGAKIAYNIDEFDVVGGINSSPIKLVKCETVDLEVPANTEIVIEGKILPHVREDEGPFGEFTGYYAGGVRKMPIIEVTALTMRDGAIYQAGNTGVPVTENHVIKEIPWEAAVFSDLRKKYPEVRAIHYHPAGGAQFVLLVAIKQRYKGQARNIITSLLGNPLPPKIVVVVDDDVDIFDLNQVLWAITTRSQPDEDLIVLSGLTAGQLDPSVRENEISSVLGIDATRPFGKEFPPVVSVPGLDKVPDFSKYLRNRSAK